MHSPDTCMTGCSCSCPPCQLAGDHPRHAGPLAILQTERDPVTSDLADELLPTGQLRAMREGAAAAGLELVPPAARCCDWSSGHPPASPLAELEHGHDRELTRAGLR